MTRLVDRIVLNLTRTIALLAAAGALCMGVEFVWPRSTLAAAIVQVIPMAYVHGEGAEAALTGPQDPGALNRALHESDLEVAIAPNRPMSWLRRAFILSRQSGGHLTPKVVEDIWQSYRLSPLGSDDYATWRIAFVFNHWTEAPLDLRLRVITELSCIWHVAGKRADSIGPRITDRTGRFAFGLTEHRFEVEN